MPCNVWWDDDEHSVIVMEYTEPFSWSDASTAQLEVNEQIESVETPVTTIVNLSQVKNLPPGAMPNMKNLMTKVHPRTEYTILVGMSPFVRALDNTVGNVYRSVVGQSQRRSLYAKDMNEARSLVHKLRQQA